MKNTPQIRFSSFQEEWCSKRFADVFSPLANNTLSRAELSDEAGTVKNVHYGDVLIKFGEYLDTAKADIPFIASEDLAEKCQGAALQDGDVVMADTAEDTTAGKCTEIGNIRSDTIVSGLHTIPLHPQFKFSEGYLGYYMNSDAFHDQLIPLMQGTKVTSISKTYLTNTEVHFPSDSTEQTKIGKLLYSLDQMITSQQRKSEKLSTFKAACHAKMFPESGKSIPLMRLSGYQKEWINCSLGELLQFQNGFNGTRESYGSGIPLISVMDILNNHFITASNIRGKANVSAEELNRYSVVYGDVLFQRSSETFVDAGRSNVFLDPEKSVIFGGFVIRGRKKAEYDPKFMKYLLDSNPIREQIITHAQGAQHINVSQETLQDVQVYLPKDENEQKLLGEFFYNIDALLGLYQKETKKLQQLKQAMMHNMFA